MNNTRTVPDRILSALWRGAGLGLKSAILLAVSMTAASLAVAVLSWTGLLQKLGALADPVTAVIGLSGVSVVVLVTSAFLNLYAAIGALVALVLSQREAAIVAVMCLIAHSLAYESALMRRTGSSATKMIVLRIGWALAAAFAMHRVLPASADWVPGAARLSGGTLSEVIAAWAPETARLVGGLAILLFILALARSLLQEFGLIERAARVLSPFIWIFGLPSRDAYPWMVGFLSSYASSSRILSARIKEGEMKKQEADLFNHHAAMDHGLFEDTSLFLVLGFSLFWLIIPRLAIALIVVWFERIRRHRFRRSFKAGTA
ncbi:MAG: hypothetical protein E4H20_10115 [Spirochaetales bacterium]|nr:MAG: hypothetical protein E4H20_10115 [Spirochaetales bacterium]